MLTVSSAIIGCLPRCAASVVRKIHAKSESSPSTHLCDPCLQQSPHAQQSQISGPLVHIRHTATQRSESPLRIGPVIEFAVLMVGIAKANPNMNCVTIVASNIAESLVAEVGSLGKY